MDRRSVPPTQPADVSDPVTATTKARAATTATAATAAATAFVTTREAAELLGVSVGTVLNMVERGQLSAWRTEGGHRRVSLASVSAHVDAREQSIRRPTVAPIVSPLAGTPVTPSASERRLRVLVIEDDEFQRELYRDQFAAWQLPVDLHLAMSGIDGLTEIGHKEPDVLLIDLMMPEVDGFAVIRYLRGGPRYDAMDIIAISGMTPEKVAAAGGLPDGVPFWAKPIPFLQLRGFLEARMLSLQRERRS